LELVEAERLFGRGLAWVDVNLLATAVAERAPLWTLDRALARAATRLGREA
jgi:predicted nucleic acid-binding protein